MRNLFNKLRQTPKQIFAIVAVAAAVVTVPAALLAWGPDRTTYTVENPAKKVVFNSITNNPHVGDERNFVVIKDAANTNAGGWKDEINVEKGKEYLVRMYVHNNAAANLNKVATNTRVKAHVPTTTGKSVQIDGFVSADNADPKQVWDQAILKSGNGENFNVAYVAGSARLYNNKFGQTGAKLSDGIVTSAGALVGYDKLDGKIPGCFEYAGYVTFKVKPQFAPENDFEMSKKVRKSGDKEWKESVAAQAGDKVDYLIEYKNSGETRQNNVHVRDYLPKGMSYVPGTAKLANPTNPGGVKTDDGVTTGNGLNIGDYQAGSNAFLMFTAQVAKKADLECGPNKLKNVARVTADGGYKEDDADVTVPGDECKPEPVYACDALSVNQLSRTKFEFDTAYSAENATYVRTVYVVRDAAGNEVYRGEDTSFTASQAGSYTVQSYVTFSVNGENKTVSDPDCKKEFKVTPPPAPEKLEVCDLKSKEIITIDKDDFDANKHSLDYEDCKEAPKTDKVCEIKTGRIVTITEGEFDATKHSKTLSDCDTPPELPYTGPADLIAKMTGLVSLTSATLYYVTSRRM